MNIKILLIGYNIRYVEGLWNSKERRKKACWDDNLPSTRVQDIMFSMSMCMCICISVSLLAYFKNHTCFLVFFVADIMFSYNGLYTDENGLPSFARWQHHHVATGAKSAVLDCLVLQEDTKSSYLSQEMTKLLNK